MIGTTISHYKIIEKLGGGGMGIVYKAQDLKLDRFVALKFLPPDLTRDPESKQRFIHEAKAASALQHNNICTVHDIDETDDGQMFIVMDLCEGETLKKRIERGPLKIEEAIDIAIQVAQGLEEAHKHHIVHRDIKPANVLVAGNGVVKIVDFGLAKLAGQTVLTKSGSMVGTAAYMSPEQVKGEAVDARTDIWSIGILIYEMVTGQRPFKGEYDNAVMYSILNAQPEAMTGLRKDVSIELDRIVTKAIAKEYSKRYQHIDEMLADLRRVNKGAETGETSGVKVPRIAAPKKWLRVAAAAVVGLLALMLTVIFDPFGLGTLLKESEKTSSKTLAVMYFDNIRDPDDKDRYGELLMRLMITSLSQTKGLEVISRERLYDIQRELGQTGSVKIEASLASRIAQRAGATIMLTGNIVEAQPQLAVTTQLVDVKSGIVLASQRVSPYRSDQLFGLIDSLSFLVRNDLMLGQDSYLQTKPVSSVTTSSLAAYRAYVEGDELRKRLMGLDASTVLKRAIELDPRFAMAYYALRFANNLLGDLDGARAAIVKAWELRSNVTEPERLMIEAGYYNDIEADNAKAARVLENLVSKFPHYQGAYTELVATYFHRCQFEEAQRVLSIGLKYDSLDKRLLNQIAYLSAGRNEREKALKAVNQELLASPGDPNIYDSKGDIYCLLGYLDSASYWFNMANSFRANFSARNLARLSLIRQDYVAAAEHFKNLASWGPTDKAESECALALISMHHGKIRLAQKQLQTIFLSRTAQGHRQAVLTESAYLALLSYELRAYNAMVEYAQIRSREVRRNMTNTVYGRDVLAWAWLLNGNLERSSALVSEISRDIEGKSPRWQLVLDYAKALLMFEKADYQNSLRQFRKAFQPLFPNRAPEYHFGIVLLKTGNISEGIHELQRVTNWFPLLWNVVNIFPTNMYWPIASVKAHYWLGVAYEEQRDYGKAIQEYETFLAIWRNADFDSQEIKDAKVRLQKLKGVMGK